MKKTVLVVDDFAMMRAATAMPLKVSGYQIVEAQNGAEALEYMQCDDATVDLIVTDLNMPELGGIELIRRVRTTTRFKYVPIIALSTQPREKEVKEVGGTAFMQKPYVLNNLLDTIKKLLR